MKKDDSTQENSLGQLTKNFLNYIKTTGRKSININDLVNELSVKKRRIYDITNVLQGIDYLQKSGKNEIVWTKSISNKSKLKKKINAPRKNNINKQKINIEELEKEKDELNNDIDKFKAEFNSIAKKMILLNMVILLWKI
jgi:multidrug resistance efflux pump